MKFIVLTLLISLTSSVLACAEMGTIVEKPAKQARQIFAKKIYERLIEIDNAIPSLKPDDKKWIEGEVNSGNMARQFQARQSKEGMIYEVKKTFSQFMPAVKMLVDGKYQNLQHEILLWTNIAHLLTLSDTWEIIAQLDMKGYVVIQKSHTSLGSGTYLFICTNKASAIIRNIVIPYLANKLPG